MTAREPVLPTLQDPNAIDVFGPTQRPEQHIADGLNAGSIAQAQRSQAPPNVQQILHNAFRLTGSPYLLRLMRLNRNG